MQLKPALRTFLIRRHPRQHRPALRAPRHCTRPRQIQRSRTHGMVPLRWAALAFLGRLPRFLSARLTITVLISMLPVFRHNPSQTRAYCHPDAPPPASLSRGRERHPRCTCSSPRSHRHFLSELRGQKLFADVFRPRPKSHTISQ
jgi:hypothetical protein